MPRTLNFKHFCLKKRKKKKKKQTRVFEIPRTHLQTLGYQNANIEARALRKRALYAGKFALEFNQVECRSFINETCQSNYLQE